MVEDRPEERASKHAALLTQRNRCNALPLVLTRPDGRPGAAAREAKAWTAERQHSGAGASASSCSASSSLMQPRGRDACARANAPDSTRTPAHPWLHTTGRSAPAVLAP